MKFTQWSKPFHGVQHLAVPVPYQVTVEDYCSFAVLTIVNLHMQPFTNHLVKKNFDNAGDARAHGERWINNNFLGV